MTTNETGIHTRALLVCLTIATWTARKFDRQISTKVNRELNANADAGRYNKFLLPGDATAYKALISLAGSIRAAHYSKTLAWSDDNRRLLPSAMYLAYMEWFREQSAAFNRAFDAFAIEYPTLCADAPKLLGAAYRSDDFPTINELRHKFRIEISPEPIPIAGDIRVSLGHDQIAEIETAVTSRIETATRTAMADAWQRLYSVVSHMADRLSDPDAIFRDSMIENAQAVCASLESLNITNDPDLEAMRVRVAAELANQDPNDLRKGKAYRKDTAARANEIMSAMKGLYGNCEVAK